MAVEIGNMIGIGQTDKGPATASPVFGGFGAQPEVHAIRKTDFVSDMQPRRFPGVTARRDLARENANLKLELMARRKKCEQVLNKLNTVLSMLAHAESYIASGQPRGSYVRGGLGTTRARVMPRPKALTTQFRKQRDLARENAELKMQLMLLIRQCDELRRQLRIAQNLLRYAEQFLLSNLPASRYRRPSFGATP